MDGYEIEGDIDAYTPETTHDVDKNTLLRVMASLPNMRAPGPFGLRYEHIKSLASTKLEQSTRDNILGGASLANAGNSMRYSATMVYALSLIHI